MKPLRIFIMVICLLLVSVAAGCSDSKTNILEKVSTEKTAASEQPTQSTEQPMPAPTAKQPNPTITNQNKELSSAGGNLTVHFLDVGQGDSILLEHGDDTMLIDSGEIGKGDDVATHIMGEGIMSLDYVVATHLHSDHMGGCPLFLMISQ
jgi:beta-lactamase superfamily II metal-dependent hydrolase